MLLYIRRLDYIWFPCSQPQGADLIRRAGAAPLLDLMRRESSVVAGAHGRPKTMSSNTARCGGILTGLSHDIHQGTFRDISAAGGVVDSCSLSAPPKYHFRLSTPFQDTTSAPPARGVLTLRTSIAVAERAQTASRLARERCIDHTQSHQHLGCGCRFCMVALT